MLNGRCAFPSAGSRVLGLQDLWTLGGKMCEAFWPGLGWLCVFFTPEILPPGYHSWAVYVDGETRL